MPDAPSSPIQPSRGRPARRRARRAALLALPLGITMLAGAACAEEDGSGDLATVRWDDFVDPEITGVSVQDDFDVIVRVDPSLPQSAQIVIDDNLVDDGFASIVDGVLTIDYSSFSRVNPSRTPVVTLTVKRIESIENHGDGNVVVAGVDSDELDVVNGDDGTVTVSGSTDAVDVRSTSAGHVDLHDLVARRVELGDTDDGLVEVHATEVISGSISGDADVVVSGNPTSVDVDLEGNGELVAV
jgi:hypothetical protein